MNARDEGEQALLPKRDHMSARDETTEASSQAIDQMLDGPSVYGFAAHDEATVDSTNKVESPAGHQATLRLRPNTLSAIANREGDHFTVLEQHEGAPVLRDFPTAGDLIDFLRQLTGFRGMLQPESDEVSDKDRLMRGRSRDVDTASSRTASEHSVGSSTSVASSMSGIQPTKVMWIDMQTRDGDLVEALLSLFPRIELDTIEDIRLHDAPDTAHWFAKQRYLFANLDCDSAAFLGRSFILNKRTAAFSDGSSAMMSLVAFSDVVITIHESPIAGHREALQTLHELVSAKRAKPAVVLSPRHASANNSSRRGAQLAPVERPPVHMHVQKKKKRLTVGIILATLIESVVIACLPDPTVSLAEVDRIDEMVLLVSQDQHDLLRRIARIRRVLSSERSKLYRKERFLQTFITPALRASFVSASSSEQYRHLLGEVYHVAERLEAARDALTQANSNFVSHISLQVSQTSNHMNTKMKALSQVATICMPLNILTGLMGMNVTVPFNTTAYPDTLVPFYVILSIMAGLLMVGIPMIWKGLIKDKHLHSQSEGMVTVAIDD